MKRVIVCGFGFMGQNHAGNIFRCKDLELAAVVDSTPKSEIKPVKGNVATESFDWEKLKDIPFFPTLTEALAGCKADAVLIATPTRFHAALAMEAAAHGKHVFVEKPLCSNLEEAALLREALKGKDLVFQVGHCVRFKKEYRFLQECCQDKRFGELRNLKLFRVTGKPNWGVWKDLDVSLTSASGPLFDLNIHDIDYALSILGEPSEASIAPAEYSNAVFRTEWKYPNGSTMEIDGGFPLPSTIPFRAGFTAVFEHAMLECDSRMGDKLTVSSEQECRTVDCKSERSIYMDEVAEFAASMIDGAPVRCGLEDGIKAVTWCYRLRDMLLPK